MAGSEETGQTLRAYAHAWLAADVEDGKLRECWLYDEDQRFIDKLWSSEPGE